LSWVAEEGTPVVSRQGAGGFRSSWSAAALLLAATLAACGGAASPTPSATSAASAPSAAPTKTAAPTEAPATPTSTPTSAAPPTDPPTFESAVYPYALQLPPGVLTRLWKAATLAWDGEARFGTDTRNVDITGTTGGGLLVIGTPWSGTVEELRARMAELAQRFHSCDRIGDLQTFDIGGVPAVGEREVCAQDTPVAMLVLLNDGYGLAFRVMLIPGQEDVVLTDLASWLEAGLTWTLR
jgi:hypothetical protein